MTEEATKVPEPITNALYVTCTCGLARLLPSGLEIGQDVTLPSCPRCGSFFHGTFVGNRIDLRD